MDEEFEKKKGRLNVGMEEECSTHCVLVSTVVPLRIGGGEFGEKSHVALCISRTKL